MTVLAYIDPGSGLLVWQMLVAAFVGCLFYLKKSRDFLFRMAGKLLRRNRHEPAAPPPPQH